MLPDNHRANNRQNYHAFPKWDAYEIRIPSFSWMIVEKDRVLAWLTGYVNFERTLLGPPTKLSANHANFVRFSCSHIPGTVKFEAFKLRFQYRWTMKQAISLVMRGIFCGMRLTYVNVRKCILLRRQEKLKFAY